MPKAVSTPSTIATAPVRASSERPRGDAAVLLAGFVALRRPGAQIEFLVAAMRIHAGEDPPGPAPRAPPGAVHRHERRQLAALAPSAFCERQRGSIAQTVSYPCSRPRRARRSRGPRPARRPGRADALPRGLPRCAGRRWWHTGVRAAHAKRRASRASLKMTGTGRPCETGADCPAAKGAMTDPAQETLIRSLCRKAAHLCLWTAARWMRLAGWFERHG